MNRRALLALVLLGATLAPAWAAPGVAQGMHGVQPGLEQWAREAISRLGQQNGYFAHPQVRIDLPKKFTKAERILRALGHGGKVDALVLAMNRTAEQALPGLETAVLAAVQESVRTLSAAEARPQSVADPASATQHFRQASEARLNAELSPIIRSVAARAGLDDAYRILAAQLRAIAGLKSEQAVVEAYVGMKALEGFFTVMGLEERAQGATRSTTPGRPAGQKLVIQNTKQESRT
jgi:hypothetical protein